MPRGLFIFGKKIRQLRDQRLMTQAELAQAVGISPETIRRIENLDVAGIGASNVTKLARVFGLTLEQVQETLLTGAVHPPLLTTADQLGIRQPASRKTSVPALRPVPLYHGASAVQSDLREDVQLGEVDAPAIADFAVVARGDCMEPRIRDGEVICCSLRRWRREGFIWGHEYWIRFRDGESTLKSVQADETNHEAFVCVPLNPSATPFVRLKADVESAALVVGILNARP